MENKTKKLSLKQKLGIGAGVVTVGLIGLGSISEPVEEVQLVQDAEVVQVDTAEELENEDVQDKQAEAVEVVTVSNEQEVSVPARVEEEPASSQEVVEQPVIETTEEPQEDKSVVYCSGVDINRATAEELKAIIHIDEERAIEMLRIRPFASVDAMTRINGIGAARVSDIQEQGLACV